MTVVGRVAEVWLYPVKSMGGTPVNRAEVGSGGLAGDRAWSVVDATGDVPVKASDEPRLREVRTRWDDGRLLLAVPGRPGWIDPSRAGVELSAWLGRPLRLERRDPGERGFVDVAAVHLVSRGAIASGSASAAGADACDPQDPRANLVLDVADPGAAENAWVDREVTVGEVLLRVSRRPKHCLGVYAEVVRGGAVEVSSRVEL